MRYAIYTLAALALAADPALAQQAQPAPPVYIGPPGSYMHQQRPPLVAGAPQQQPCAVAQQQQQRARLIIAVNRRDDEYAAWRGCN